MKILVYGINYEPDLIGVGKYTAEMCRHLSRAGHEIRVVTAPPYYPAWRISKPYKSYSYRTEKREDIRVTRCPLYVPKTQTGLKRILHHLSFAVASAPAMIAVSLTFRPDIILTIAPSLLTVPATVVAGRLSGAVKWLHVQDFEIDAAFDLGFVSGSTFKRVALSAERFFLKLFDVVSTISPKMIELLKAKGVAPARCVEFRNWVDTKVIRPAELQNPIRKLLAIPDGAKIALYSGNMGNKQGMEYLAEAARNLADRRSDIVFVICGAGPMKEKLRNWTSGLSNVRLLDLQPAETYGQLLAAADMHLLPQRPEVHDLMLPSKLAFMQASGRPVIAMARKHTQLYAELEGAGILISPGDAVALTEAIVKLLDNQELRSSLGLKGRELAQTRWDQAGILAQIESKMRESCSSSRNAAPYVEKQSKAYLAGRAPFTEAPVQKP
jgi:colanic acid biosynthesis glycosyl transferase WcaI